MKNLFFLFLFISVNLFPQTLLEENFDYTDSQHITSNGWSAYRATGSNPILVSPGSLSHIIYSSSGILQFISVYNFNLYIANSKVNVIKHKGNKLKI